METEGRLGLVLPDWVVFCLTRQLNEIFLVPYTLSAFEKCFVSEIRAYPNDHRLDISIRQKSTKPSVLQALYSIWKFCWMLHQKESLPDVCCQVICTLKIF